MSSSENLKIPLEDILSATNRFSEANIIARGGFGKVYRGQSTQHGILAIKRLDRLHRQGDREYGMEIALLSAYKHENLVALVGFCEEGAEKILVYKYETNGSLDKHLHKKDLTWERRLQICIDAARGLRYLHDEVGSQHRVIHRDIKSANILLDENMKAKISDFGLSKVGLANVPFSVLFSAPCGTYGYVDPEFLRGALTQKSDVYSFGVVLFEVLFGKLVSVAQVVDDRHFTVEMAQNHHKNNTLDEMIEPDIRIQMTSASLRTFSTVAYECLKNRRDDRPTMRLVLEELERALGHQQEIELSRPNKALSGFSHDVYISVRKKDIPVAYFNEIYGVLEEKGLSVYTDNLKRSLKKSVMLEAIEQSRSSIIFFSKNFAGNPWCLDEAVKIMECRKEKNQVVLPIYFKVGSSKVRTQSGYFGEALFKFNDHSRIEVWRNALAEAPSQKGVVYRGVRQDLERAASMIKEQLSKRSS